MRHVHPLTALALAFQAALLALLVERPATLLALVAVAALYALAGGGWRWWRWLLLVLLVGTWTMAITQGLFYGGSPRTVWLELLPPRWFPLPAYSGDPPGLYLYREGVAHGVLQSLRVDAVVLLGAGLLARYSADRLAVGLRAAGIPAPICFLAAMALRHIPLLAAEARTLWVAQRLRGLRLLDPRPFALPRRVLLPLLAANVRRADEIAAALQSRGFSLPALARMLPERAPGAERAVAWLGAVLLTALCAAILLTRLHLAGALSLPALEGLYAWVVDHV